MKIFTNIFGLFLCLSAFAGSSEKVPEEKWDGPHAPTGMSRDSECVTAIEMGKPCRVCVLSARWKNPEKVLKAIADAWQSDYGRDKDGQLSGQPTVGSITYRTAGNHRACAVISIATVSSRPKSERSTSDTGSGPIEPTAIVPAR
jgi:hypothetical protein